ncbi:MAG: hypothetical protein LH472_06160 [Pyrinomonadaceae bacterium]|nr:hypothetical protein [Pyrinomonadaceae bacterium]
MKSSESKRGTPFAPPAKRGGNTLSAWTLNTAENIAQLLLTCLTHLTRNAKSCGGAA